MERFELKEITSKKTWEKFLLSKTPRSFLQSWNWGETNKLCGSNIFRFGVFKNGVLDGLVQLIEQKAKRGRHLIIPGGPIIDWENKQLVIYLVTKIKDFAKTLGAGFVRVRPEILDTHENRTLFKALGFISSPMHLNAENTWILNLEKEEQEILAEMRKSTRYLIKKSWSEGFELEKTTDLTAAEILSELQVDTARRHKFVGFSKKLFEAQLDTFGRDAMCQMFIARQNGKVLSAAIIIFYGDTAYYHHSGSSDSSKKTPVAYFLQWEVIKEAKKRKLKYYNFWGVAPNDNPRHRFFGVTLFKKGFGGNQVDWLHAHDLPVSPLYFLTYIFETGRKLFRRL